MIILDKTNQETGKKWYITQWIKIFMFRVWTLLRSFNVQRTFIAMMADTCERMLASNWFHDIKPDKD